MRMDVDAIKKQTDRQLDADRIADALGTGDIETALAALVIELVDVRAQLRDVRAGVVAPVPTSEGAEG